MRTPRTVVAAVIGFALLTVLQNSASAQVVETREGEANPTGVIFRSTLYGAGTGLVLGGAYALVDEGDDPSTGSILAWGVAGGAAAGFLIGVIHTLTRSGPEGDAEVTSALQVRDGDTRLAIPGVMLKAQRDPAGNTSRVAEVNLVRVRF